MENNKVDRTTRLIVTLTMFGGTWFLLKNVFKSWVNIFSSSAYTQSFISIENIISVISFTVILTIIIKVILYIYAELKTFQMFESEEEKQTIYKSADIKFNDIFKTIKKCAYAILGVALLFGIFELFNDPNLLGYFILGALLALIFFIILFFVKKEKLKKVVSKAEKIEETIAPYGSLIYISFLALFVGICITLVSFNQNQFVEVNFKDNNENIALELIVQNMENIEATINIVNDKENISPNVIRLDNNDFNRNVIEVYDDTKTDNYKFYIKKSRNQYTHSLDLSEYIIDGRNVVEIKIISNQMSRNKVVKIENEIEKNESEITFSEDSFIVNP
ncbi:hypothetical protein [Piscibacillus salipiscarius]|uniref:Uncharacterized protein n=1 Tax=Piscibacillus salipiscarius TaxID=299480 RepID=A0ABW5QDF3_9BACI